MHAYKLALPDKYNKNIINNLIKIFKLVGKKKKMQQDLKFG